jgi:hypothetical protein
MADNSVTETDDGDLMSTARAGKHESADETASVGNEGDAVSPAREDTPSDAPGKEDGEKLHKPGEPYTADNPVARAVIYDARDDLPVGDEGTNAEAAVEGK